MIVVTGVNNKKVKDPVFLAVRRWMEERIRRLESQGPSAELDLARLRYTGLTATDVIIEPPVSFSNGKELACFVSRKTGFLRGDSEIEKIDVSLVFEEFNVVVTSYATTADLVQKVKIDDQLSGVVFNRETGKYGLVIAKANVNPDTAMAMMNGIYWDSIYTDNKDIDFDNWNSGTFGFKSVCIEDYVGHLFIIEDVKARA